MSDERITSLPCAECKRPVALETAVSDDRGQPVHKECYELRLATDLEARSATSDNLIGAARTMWPQAYREAMCELENALLTGRILEARTEISKRLTELDQLPELHAQERQAIADALEGLRSLDQEDRRKKAAEIGKEAVAKVSSISATFAPLPSERAS